MTTSDGLAGGRASRVDSPEAGKGAFARLLTTVAALSATVLLWGSYAFVLAVAVAAGIAGGFLLLARDPAPWLGEVVSAGPVPEALGAACAVLAVAILPGWYGALRTVRHVSTGLPVNLHNGPQLWDLVHDTATRLGVPPPDEIRLVSEVRVSMVEETGWLGAAVRRRHLYLGMPAVVGLTRAELRALIARQLAHGSRPGNRLPALWYRVSLAVHQAQSRAFDQSRGPARRLFLWYSYAYWFCFAGFGRERELAADGCAAWLCGGRVAAAAAWRAAVLEVGWEHFVREYVSQGLSQGLAPKGVYAALPLVLAARSDEYATIAEEVLDHPLSRLTPFPGTAERNANWRKASDMGRVVDSGPAWRLLADYPGVAATLEAELIGPGRHRLVDWAVYGPEAMVSRARETAEAAFRAIGAVSDQTLPSLSFVLGEVEAGRGRALFPALRHAGLRPKGLRAVIWVAAFDSGAIRLVHRWDRRLQAETVDGRPFRAAAYADLLSAAPESAIALRAALITAGIDPAKARSRGVPVTRDPRVLGAVGAVRLGRMPADLIVTDRGLLFVPVTTGATPRDRVTSLLHRFTVSELAVRPAAFWIARERILAAGLTRVGTSWDLSRLRTAPDWEPPVRIRLTTDDRVVHTVALTVRTESLSQGRQVLLDYLGVSE